MRVCSHHLIDSWSDQRSPSRDVLNYVKVLTFSVLNFRNQTCFGECAYRLVYTICARLESRQLYCEWRWHDLMILAAHLKLFSHKRYVSEKVARTYVQQSALANHQA